jgi:ketopantoate reductase
MPADATSLFGHNQIKNYERINMKPSVVIIGMGEMAGVFARAFLKSGYPVIPVRRQDDMQSLASEIPTPYLVLLAVAEKDLDEALSQVPQNWHDHLVLLQNELLPSSWQSHKISDPTVISVWFEKKSGQDYKVVVPSPVYGPHASILVKALSTLAIPAVQMQSKADLLFELIRKNLYILTTNICGLECGGNVKQLWANNSILMNRVFDDILLIQQSLSGVNFNRDQLLNAVLEAFDGDPEHNCMGRSAPERLHRALKVAESFNLDVPELKRLDRRKNQLIEH